MTTTKKVQIVKAGKVYQRQQIPDVLIRISGSPSDDMSGQQAESFWRQQGALLAHTLKYSLPGGTLDALLAELLEARASTFRVPMFVTKKETNSEVVP